MNKVDLSKERTKEEWSNLLNAVMRDDNNLLSVDEKAYYIDEINYKITGSRHSKIEILKDIEAGMADIDDVM
jgi:hypothetical protein